MSPSATNVKPVITSRLWAAVLLVSLLPGTVAAEIVSRQAPINIEADSAELQETISTYSGNVRVEQGSVTMSGSQLIVRRSNGDNFTFTLSGSPARITQAPSEAGDPDIRGSARRIDYASGAEVLELRGDAVIFRGKEKIAGGDIRYSFASRRTIVNNRGGSNGGRVKITLQPGGSSNGTEGQQ
ncbi:MAG: lipopolysaccharide transport periplasmic protein LptA [Salinisphaeraceae bacterium]|nr:lipopolysaccharide transport periplasmic protein LptA [Salinisphaeraceae bacterium]